jgi:hypothetical protein
MRESRSNLQARCTLIAHTCREERVEQGYAHRDAKDTTRSLKDSKKACGRCGILSHHPDTQAGRRCTARSDEADAQDEMGKALNNLGLILEPVDTSSKVLSNENENGNLSPAIMFPPSRSWTNVPAVTTTVMGTSASLKAIKASSRKPTSQSIVSQWLASNYGLENILRSKRTRADLETEETAGQLGVGGSLLGSINVPLSSEQGKVNEEDARPLKRRRAEGPSPGP